MAALRLPMPGALADLVTRLAKNLSSISGTRGSELVQRVRQRLAKASRTLQHGVRYIVAAM